MPIEEVLRIGREAAEGLCAAHVAGLIHRDIKPANIWLEAPQGRVKILDFGLARSATGQSSLTQQGVIVGTPAYMAPEQGAGETVDQRCDLFSLGCVLYRLCTGKVPFKGKDLASTLVAVATVNPPAPAEINPEVPPRLSDLVMHLLAKDPNDRPQTARHLAAELRAIAGELKRAANGSSTPATLPAPATASLQKQAGKQGRRVKLYAGAIVALLLVSGAMGAYYLFMHPIEGTLRVEVDDDADGLFQKGELRILNANGDLLHALKPSQRHKGLPSRSVQARFSLQRATHAFPTGVSYRIGGKSGLQ